MKHALVLLAFAGCYRPSSSVSCEVLCAGEDSTSVECATCIANNPDASVGDGSHDDGVLPDQPTGPFCYGTAPMQPCFDTEPTGLVTLTGVYNTDLNCPFPRTLDGREVCVYAATDIVVVNKARFSGAKPLVLVGVFSISIGVGAVLDLSSSIDPITMRAGAGADPIGGCGTQSAPAALQDGAAGGSFASKGGDGGQGNLGETPGVAAAAQAVAVRGGCQGGKNVNNALGGPGGGAVYLISNALMQDGLILATGGGGSGGGDSAGGGGGGSGGYIGVDVETPVLTGQGRLVAAGGGGGGGGCMGSSGGRGTDATAASTAGGSGADTQPFGDGGAGSLTLGEQGKPGNSADGETCAGGGGGGGPGAIRFFRNKQCSTHCIPAAVTVP